MSPDRDVPPDDRSGAPDPDVDAAFAQIVAGWDDEPIPEVPPWPATEDVTDRPAPPVDRGSSETSAAEPSGTAATGDESANPTAGGSVGTPRSWPPAERERPGAPPEPPAGPPPAGPPDPGPRDWAAAEEPDEGYVPPEPPPLPRGDVVSRLAWAGVLLGPAFLLLSALVWDGAGPVPLGLAALAFIGGFVTLVARLPARRDDEDDDGAVV